jgi:hypothetical protein
MITFKKENNPLDSLRIGQKAGICNWLDEMGVENYFINDDFTINVCVVCLNNKNLCKFPEYIQFNIVRSFDINDNYFTNLIGCPKEVTTFFCSRNPIRSLEGCPEFVYNSFWCTENKGIQIFKSDILQYCEVDPCKINL